MRRHPFSRYLEKLAATLDDTTDPWAALASGIVQPNYWDQLAGLTGTAGTGLGLYGAYHLGAARPSTPAALGAAAAAAQSPEVVGAFRSVNPGSYRWARGYEQQIMDIARREAAMAHAQGGLRGLPAPTPPGLPAPKLLGLPAPDPSLSWRNLVNPPPVVEPIVEPPVHTVGRAMRTSPTVQGARQVSPSVAQIVEQAAQNAGRTAGSAGAATVLKSTVPPPKAQSPVWQNLKGRWSAMRGGPRAALAASLASIPLSMMFRHWAAQSRQGQMQEMLNRIQEREAMLQYLLMQQAQAQANKPRGLLSWLFG
jgi:hypothetical protein